MTSIAQQIKDCDELKAKLLVRQDKIRANKTFMCLCGDRHLHRIKECVVIQTHYYVDPHGCTSGDYWSGGEMQIICPTTDKKNRILFPEKYNSRVDYKDIDSRFSRMYGHLFKQRVDDYKEDNRSWVNNYYFSEHKTKFELALQD